MTGDLVGPALQQGHGVAEPQPRERVARLQAAQTDGTAAPTAEPREQFVEPLTVLAEDESRVGALQPPRQAVGARADALQATRYRDDSRCRSSMRDALQPLAPVRHDQFRCARGRRRAHVGHQVCDGEVDLVADAAHDREWAGEYRPGDDLLVEGPEILERTAAPRQESGRRTPRGPRRCASAATMSVFACSPCTCTG